uniref:Uncharacterized protein n=1 Tax=Schistosoma haematobium TaxID=6185 RepID=A0A094ZJ40_SCHHA
MFTYIYISHLLTFYQTVDIYNKVDVVLLIIDKLLRHRSMMLCDELFVVVIVVKNIIEKDSRTNQINIHPK